MGDPQKLAGGLRQSITSDSLAMHEEDGGESALLQNPDIDRGVEHPMEG